MGEQVTGDFMWMYEVELSGGPWIQAYKHIDTRRYIRRASAADVLAEVFASLPGLAGVTNAQIRASWDAVDRLS